MRAFVALLAASVAVGICLYQGHFVLSAANPQDWWRVMIHRCADLMVAMTVWMGIEAVYVCSVFGWEREKGGCAAERPENAVAGAE